MIIWFVKVGFSILCDCIVLHVRNSMYVLYKNNTYIYIYIHIVFCELDFDGALLPQVFGAALLQDLVGRMRMRCNPSGDGIELRLGHNFFKS